MKRNYSLTVAIPAYNEAEALPGVLAGALKIAPLYAKNFEILVVDDGSVDATGKIADAAARKNRHVRVVHHPKNQGFSGAIKSCYRQANGEIIFLLPADGQIHMTDLGRFWVKLPQADVVVGHRLNNPEPASRKINSAVFHTLYRMLFGVRLQEISTSILWKKEVLDSLDITAIPRSALIEPEVVYKAWARGYRFAQVGIPYYAREGGTPKGSNPVMIFMTIKELFRLWWQMRVARKNLSTDHESDAKK